MQADLMQMCREDIVFFACAFVYVHEPRPAVADNAILNFTCLPFHWWYLPLLDERCGKTDLLTEKSRDMTATWSYLITYLKYWLFVPGQSFLMISRKEELVEKRGDPKALFTRLDHMIRHLPAWMLPAMTRTDRHLGNEDNGSSIDGETTSGDVAAGDRRTSVFMDEYARVQLSEQALVLGSVTSVTDSRFIASTHQGTATPFYRLSRDPAIPKVKLHWTLHPRKVKGLYTSEDGALKILDTAHEFPSKPDGTLCCYTQTDPDGSVVYWDFVLDGKTRSPWYDNECRRLIYAHIIATEIDMDPQGSVARWFPAELVAKVLPRVREPLRVGRLRFSAITGQLEESDAWVDDSHGQMQLWFTPDENGQVPPDREYIIGFDIAAGTGASNSVAKGYDRATGEQILEYADPFITPENFGTLGAALHHWFNGAFLIWEANGHGRPFGQRVIDLGVRHVYYRQDEESLTRKQSMRPGWFSTATTKKSLFTEYRRGLDQGEIIERSRASVDELEEYIHAVGGKVIHVRSLLRDDPSGAGDNHGDRCVAGAVAQHGMHRRPLATPEPAPKREAPYGSLAWRRQEFEKTAQSEEWPR